MCEAIERNREEAEKTANCKISVGEHTQNNSWVFCFRGEYVELHGM